MSTEFNPCPKCGGALPADAPQGLCPRCLAALNFATETLPLDAPPLSPQAPLTPEELAPHFPQLEIIQCLGRGGMGVVYKARQKTLNRLVALKLLAPERSADTKFAARFEKEAQALAALNHPHIVTIHDFGQAGGFFFLLMEFVDGVNLRQAMTAGRFTPEQALAIVPPVCEALQYAHEHGIVHRDIKPENLLLDKTGRLKIADFGIAKMIGATGEKGGESMSQPLGTPAYAAPEQKDDTRQVDHRADIYSLGVVLYELLTGELPKDKFEAPSKRVHIDVRLDEVVLRALETQPELRFATAAEFRTQLAGVVATPPAMPDTSATRSRKWLRASIGIVAAVAAALLGAVFMLRQNNSHSVPEPVRNKVFITSEQSEAASWVNLRWAVSAQAPGLVIISHEKVRLSSPLQWNHDSQDYEVQVRMEMSRVKDELIRIRMQVGDSGDMKELIGNFSQLREEILTSRLISGKAESNAAITICQLLGEPLILELPDGISAGPSTATPAEQFASSLTTLGLQLAMLALLLGGYIWLIRLLFKRQRIGCAVLLILLLGFLLLLAIPATLWFFKSRSLSHSAVPAKSADLPKPAASAMEIRLEGELLACLQKEAELSETLGRKHPQIEALHRQIELLQKQLDQERAKISRIVPRFVLDDPRFITSSNRSLQLNLRYTLFVGLMPMLGKDVTTSMRSYTLKDNQSDGVKATTTFAPLAIQNERFIIFWDREKNELWLASPTILRRHHLPEHGEPEEQMYMRPDIPESFKQRMPEPFRKAITPWHFSEAPVNLRPDEVTDGDLSIFLTMPQTGTAELIATLTRMHYFANDGPAEEDLDCFKIETERAEGHAFVRSSSSLGKSLRTLLPWEKSGRFKTQLIWKQEGAKRWIELLGATPL